MIQEKTTGSQHGMENREGDFSPVDVLIILAKNKKLIIFFPLVAVLVAIVVTLLLPNVYKASVTLLPPQQAQSATAAILSQLGGVAGAAAGVAGLKNPNDLYVGMLKSRTIANSLIEKYDLKKVYDLESLEKTRAALESNSLVSSAKDGLITITVEDKNQKLVAKIANSYSEELLKLTRTLAITEAAKRRLFFEQQLTMAKNNLATAEMLLKSALDVRGVISVDSDSRAIVETVSRLRAQVSAKEIQLNSMDVFVTKNNQEYKRIQAELISLRAELSKLENGRVGEVTPAQNLNNQAGLENIKILRDVKYYQMLYELLSKQYEAARLDEAKDSSIIQVLDPATEPERKSGPKRAIIVIATFVGAFLAALIWALLRESLHVWLSKEENVRKWEKIKSHLGTSKSKKIA
ncbi:Wzz/FepE/Etk N-terminal domain-containing protein [Janthinobacterium sp.]|uniref:Wzz/FepE/Etk N-terminal domain-containing protein n=1 Tax=Janthinobacterium sp. TaxID=1871054 RepID=UPI002DB7B732|nr:Wzz/FepE/Etk N-terminal domain-containing protein [Janthinobacterium sp.]HEU4819224.1 Wzz/FepE/Etk N-terminal domain-containing protein [Janthinobacterium sp.]